MSKKSLIIILAIIIIILIIVAIIIYLPKTEKRQEKPELSPEQEEIKPLEEQKGYKPPAKDEEIKPLEEKEGYQPPAKEDVPPLEQESPPPR